MGEFPRCVSAVELHRVAAAELHRARFGGGSHWEAAELHADGAALSTLPEDSAERCAAGASVERVAAIAAAPVLAQKTKNEPSPVRRVTLHPEHLGRASDARFGFGPCTI